ncbi:mandelate racemase/muconate lactonizing enzyme family protein [Crateriforma spongiae]|uniref:mandelate racemase/muconate lactonizing enzyme family protein n=1 Tax=Crateriforma spongiae TaxID=2724528 RepID=UPI001447B1F6|nr:mandelate racemase/muconate lactonizing enzyme family protein [Crateriforma spongiae]
MKIQSVKTYVLTVQLGNDRFYSSQCAFPERNSLLVRIETDDGAVGWGEGGQYGPAEPVAACIDHVLAPEIIGRSPRESGRIWEELYAATRDFGQKGSYIEAISAIDIALWDLKGQSFGVPVHELLGGAFRQSVPAYATGCYYRGEDVKEIERGLPQLAEEAHSYVQAGFDLLKIKIGLVSIEDDRRRLEAVRSAVGPTTGILVDCNHAYNATTAIRMGRVLEEFGCLLFEEPVPPEDRDGYRRVRETLDISIAGGEAEYARWGFRDLISSGCVDIAQPDLCVCGGFSEWQKINAIASAYGVPVLPHVWGSGIALAAALHAIAALPPMPHTANPIPLQNEPVVEFDQNHNPLRDDLLTQTIAIGADGKVPVPQGAGLGVTVDESTLRQFAKQDS